MTLTKQDYPFPHLVADGYWDDDLLQDVLNEFPDPDIPGWKRYEGANEKHKLEGPPGIWGPRTRDLFNEIRGIGDQLQKIFGTPKLHMETIGGGYHCIQPGGLLQMHTDFSISPRTGRHRRLNVIIYLNHDWYDEGGHLQLWDDEGPCVDVPPDFNRMVIFETSDHSWHGHPVPAERWRKSVAAYFFTEEPSAGYKGEQSTVWHPNAK